MLNSVYTDGNFYNWTPVLLMAQLGVVIKNLENNSRPCLYEEIKHPQLKSMLASDTLYVPVSLMMKYNPISGKASVRQGDLFEDYPYPYRICDEQELYRIFEVEKRGRFIFEYVKSSTEKTVSIYDVNNNTFVFREGDEVSYNLKKKDIAAMVK
jgi:hypothetical protein